jgi:hypothetical protein
VMCVHNWKRSYCSTGNGWPATAPATGWATTTGTTRSGMCPSMYPTRPR